VRARYLLLTIPPFHVKLPVGLQISR